ncbi:hypothetical protein SAMN06295905_0599 [Devosia lucknowensis]|uniref:Restriction endonuclease n=1 Tax=Devosia lucknowensis TaxID=1096929 RepID=A0A1Y6EL86_9HYPH|nr:hypothetical protein [Devosia lucknowensis]SMQ61981.1 hypothetical protein SAMN06295905_0599 [Devosia lucknowensis]
MLPSEAINGFFAEIAPFSSAYGSATVSMLCRTKYDGSLVVLKVVVRLDPLAKPPVKAPMRFAGKLAAIFSINDVGAFVRHLAEGSPVQTPYGMAVFDPSVGDANAAEMQALDSRGLTSASRLTTLRLRGSGWANIHQPDTDWALRAQEIPYSDLADLSSEYGFGEVIDGPNVMEVEAYNVAVVDPTSTVKGEQSNIRVRMARGLDPSKITVGVKVMADGQTFERLLFKGGSMDWSVAEDNPDIRVGNGYHTVPENALLHCYVSYAGAPLHSYWVRDEAVIPNSLRLVMESFDPGLEKTKRGFATVPITSRNSKVQDDLEHAVGAILWMLGFAVYRLGASTMTDAVDLIARSPAGHYLMIECTTGPLKAEKRANLKKRTAEVQASLAQSWHGWAKAIPVLVTSEATAVADTSVAEARKEGIATFTVEEMQFIVENRTLLPQSADALMQELQAQIEKGRLAIQ